MMLEIWAFLTGQKVVYLQDHDGDITKTVAKVFPGQDKMIAKRYWPHNIRVVVLLPCGNVDGGGYVKRWSYYPWMEGQKR